jgi:hypothetical protein
MVNEFADLVKVVLRRAGTIAIVFPWFLLVNSLSAQNLLPVSSNLQSSWPHPYAYGGLALSQGSGYSPAAGSAGAGLNIETNHLIDVTELSADNAHKEDSGTGHDLYFQARGFYRIRRGWYLGGGAQLNRLITDPYSKESWRPAFGGGKDLLHQDFSMRAQVLYIMPGTDHLNAVQGPEIGLWLPSPVTRSHFFYRQTLGLYEFHQTAVPGNSGTNVRGESAFVTCTVMYRF